MTVRWEAIAEEWINVHARGASPASRESLQKLLAAVRAGAHHEAVSEALALDAAVAEKLNELLAARRTGSAR